MNIFDKCKNDERIREFVRFCVVGTICTGIDAGIFYLVNLIAPYTIALICGYLISLSVNYILTVLWTFKTYPNARNLIGIVSAHIFNLFVVRMGLMRLFVEVASLTDSIAYIPTLIISVITNFFIIKLVINKLR